MRPVMWLKWAIIGLFLGSAIVVATGMNSTYEAQQSPAATLIVLAAAIVTPFARLFLFGREVVD